MQEFSWERTGFYPSPGNASRHAEIEFSRSEHRTVLCGVFGLFFLAFFFNGKIWSGFGSLSLWPVYKIIVICSVVGVKILVPEGLLVATHGGNGGGVYPRCACCVTRASSWDPTAFRGDSGFGRAPLLMAPWSFFVAAGTCVYLSYWGVGALKGQLWL